MIYEGAAAKKQVVKSGTASQRSGGEVCLQTAPSSAPKPQPCPSDVCVSSLMKKFWYLGETLLSAEQTVPPPCPQPLHSHTAAPPILQTQLILEFCSGLKLRASLTGYNLHCQISDPKLTPIYIFSLLSVLMQHIDTLSPFLFHLGFVYLLEHITHMDADDWHSQKEEETNFLITNPNSS